MLCNTTMFLIKVKVLKYIKIHNIYFEDTVFKLQLNLLIPMTTK